MQSHPPLCQAQKPHFGSIQRGAYHQLSCFLENTHALITTTWALVSVQVLCNLGLALTDPATLVGVLSSGNISGCLFSPKNPQITSSMTEGT